MCTDRSKNVRAIETIEIIKYVHEKLTLTTCTIGESRPCPLPGWHHRANSVIAGVGEPAPRLRVWETCPYYSLSPEAVWKGHSALLPPTLLINAWDSWKSYICGHESRELSLIPTSCNTWENKSCTSPVQHNRTSSDSGGVGEPAPKIRAGDRCLHFSSALWWHRHGNEAFPLPSINA